MNMDAAAVRLLAIFFHRFMFSSSSLSTSLCVRVVVLCVHILGYSNFTADAYRTHTHHTHSCNGYGCTQIAPYAHTHSENPKQIQFYFQFFFLIGLRSVFSSEYYFYYYYFVIFALVFRNAVASIGLFFMVIARGATAIKVYTYTHNTHYAHCTHNQTSNEQRTERAH